MLLPGEIPIDAIDRGDFATGAPEDRGAFRFGEDDVALTDGVDGNRLAVVIAIAVIALTFIATLFF